jgi:hypothetical protein
MLWHLFSVFRVFDVLNVAAFLIGVALLVKKTADMERFHYERVFLLTLFLSGLALYLLDYSFGALMYLASPTCMPEINFH